MMDISPETERWNTQKAKLKKQFTILTEQDLTYAEGKRSEMLSKVQKKIGKTKEELSKILSSL